MDKVIEKEVAVREALSELGLEKRKKNEKIISNGIFISLGTLILFSIISTISPHLIWKHFETINYPLHSTIEAVGAVAAIFMAFLSIELLTEKIRPSYVFISIGFLSMGIWDIFHSVVPSGNGFVLTHSLTLLVGGFFFFLSIFPIGKAVLRKKAVTLFVTSIVFIIAGILTIVFRSSLPVMVVDGHFTSTADYINFAGGMFFLVTAIKLFMDYLKHRSVGISILIFVSMLSAIVGLTFHYSHAWTDHWWFWHVLRLIAHVSILAYLLIEFLRSMKERSSALLLFEEKNAELQASEQQLRASNQQLTASEQQLKAVNQQLVANEQNLIMEKERFQILFDSEPDAIFIADPMTGILTDVNQAAVELTKHPREKLIGMHQSLLHPEDMREMIGEKFREIAEKGSRDPQHIVIQNADGEIVPVEVVGNVIKIGEKMIAIGIFRDITFRKELEKQREEAFKELENMNTDLKAQKELTDSIIDSLPGIFYQIDTQGQYRRWNRRFLEVTGMTNEEMEKINAVEFFRGDDVQNIADAMKMVFTEGETQVEADLYLKSGESIPYLFTGIQFVIEGEPFILGMGLDISDLKTAENKLKKTVHELEAFNKMAVGREKRMIDLKSKINRLSKELGKDEPYDLSFADGDD